MRALLVSWLLLAAPSLATATPTNLAPNPSFELHERWRPRDWFTPPGATALEREARTGRHAVTARSSPGLSLECYSRPVPIVAEQSYRLSGWIRARRGRARFELQVLDRQEESLVTAPGPWVTATPGWVYSAVERDAPEGATAVRLRIQVEGHATVDDVCLVPLIRNMVYNPTFDADSRGRVGMWTEETAALLPGERAGSMRGDPSGGRHGAALLLESRDRSGWFASRGIPANLPPGISRFRAEGWLRCESGNAAIRAVWLDADERVLRADLLPPAAEGSGWRRHTGEAVAPAGAVQVALAPTVSGGRAWFDDFTLSPVRPAASRRPVVRVFVNQVGYRRTGPKSVVVATNFFPARAWVGELEVVPEGGDAVMKLPLRAERIHEGDSADWGSYFWRGDFSALRRPGRYRATARIGGGRGDSFPFLVGDRVLLRATGKLGVDFFFVQRCGFEVPGWHRACHLDDARLPDGRSIDATGGWHSAGDYNKLMYENGDGGIAFALLQAHAAFPAQFARDDRDRDGLPDILDEATWGARFVAKMQDPATGGLYQHLRQGPGRAWTKWSPPEVHTDNIRGTADDPVIDPGEGSSPLVPAVWVRLGRLLAERGEANDFSQRAYRCWERTLRRDASATSPYLLLAALDLNATTGDSTYLDYARRSVEALLASQMTSGRHRGAWGSGGELAAGALAAFALKHPREPAVSRIRAAVALYRAFLESTIDNPFGLSKQSVGDKEYFFEPTSTMGTNFQQLQKAWAAALIARLNGDARALRIAADQVDWILGKNPYDLCQLEGAGSRNPPRYHHRYDSIPGRERGAVPGCIPNGFVRSVDGEDRPGFDMSRPAPGRRHASYRTSEPWLVHNMWYLMALTALQEPQAP